MWPIAKHSAFSVRLATRTSMQSFNDMGTLHAAQSSKLIKHQITKTVDGDIYTEKSTSQQTWTCSHACLPTSSMSLHQAHEDSMIPLILFIPCSLRRKCLPSNLSRNFPEDSLISCCSPQKEHPHRQNEYEVFDSCTVQ